MERNYIILIVDDDLASLEVMSDILYREGYKIAPATEGYIAIQLSTEYSIGLAIIDLNLPDMSGIQLLKAIKRLQPEMPSIIITASPSEQSLLAAWDAGAYSYLTKPIDVNLFKRTVSKALQPKGQTVKIREESVIVKWSRWIVRNK